MDGGNVSEEGGRLLAGHLQNVRDGLALIADLQGITVISLALAGVTGDVYVGQEVHFDLLHAVALAGLTAAALGVEGEAARAVGAELGIRRFGKEITNVPKDAGIGGGIGAGGAADGALVDGNDLVEMLQALHPISTF